MKKRLINILILTTLSLFSLCSCGKSEDVAVIEPETESDIILNESETVDDEIPDDTISDIESESDMTFLVDPDRPGAVALGNLPNDPRPLNNEDSVKEAQATQKAWENYSLNEMTVEQRQARRDAARAAGAVGYDIFYWEMPAGSMGDTTGYSYLYNPYTGEKYYPGDWVPGTGTYWHGEPSEMEIAWNKAKANGYHESQAK